MLVPDSARSLNEAGRSHANGSDALAVGAERARPGVDCSCLKRGAAFDARLPTTAVGNQFVLVPAGVALGIDIVPQGGAAVLHSGSQDCHDRLGQPVGSRPADPSGEGMDAREEERLVGVDVPHAGHGALRQELRLHRTTASPQPLMQHLAVERWVEGLRAHVSKCRDVLVVTGRDHSEPPESADVAEDEIVAVVHTPHGADPGIVCGALRMVAFRRCPEEGAGHAEMSDEILGAVVEIEDQVLASPAHIGDRRPDGVQRRRELGAVVCIAGDECAADQLRCKLATNRFDFWQLRHEATVASPFVDRMLARFVEELLESAHVPESLDEAAQAEAWASSAVAEWMELGGQGGDLVSHIEDTAAFPAALIRWIVDGAAPNGGPDWLADLTEQQATHAWELSSGTSDEVALIVEFEAPSTARHAMSITVADGRPTDCSVGPAGLAEAATEDDADTMEVRALDLDEGLERIRSALAQLRADELTVNGRLNVPLALRRFDVTPTTALASTGGHPAIPIPARNPDDDAWAADLLTSALRLHGAAPNGGGIGSTPGEPTVVAEARADFLARLDEGDADARTVLDVCGLPPGEASSNRSHLHLRAVAAYLRPVDLSMHPAATQHAILELEWADWLGAIIGLSRSTAGTDVDGAVLVQLINRCPEITTTIPKQDAGRIGWAFEQTLYAWAVTGVLDDAGALTEAGRWLLPRAALAAWTVGDEAQSG